MKTGLENVYFTFPLDQNMIVRPHSYGLVIKIGEQDFWRFEAKISGEEETEILESWNQWAHAAQHSWVGIETYLEVEYFIF